MENFYHILKVSESAGNEEIKKAFRMLAKRYHPDIAKGGEEKFRQISHAYKVLSNPEARNDYDKTLNNFRGKSGEFGDYTENTYTVQGKHLKKLLKEIISQWDFIDLKIKYKGKKLFDLSFPTVATLTLIGVIKVPIAFLFLNLGAAAFFEIEVTHQVTVIFNEAITNHNSGKIIKAEQLYKKILKKSEYFMPAYINLGLLYRQQGENKKAVQCFRQVLDTMPFGEIGDMARKNLTELRGF